MTVINTFETQICKPLVLGTQTGIKVMQFVGNVVIFFSLNLKGCDLKLAVW